MSQFTVEDALAELRELADRHAHDDTDESYYYESALRAAIDIVKKIGETNG